MDLPADQDLADNVAGLNLSLQQPLHPVNRLTQKSFDDLNVDNVHIVVGSPDHGACRSLRAGPKI